MRGHVWTACEEAVLRRLWPVAPRSEIASQVGQSLAACSLKAHRMGLKRRHKEPRMVKMQFSCPPEMRGALRHAAARKGIDTTALLRRLVAAELGAIGGEGAA